MSLRDEIIPYFDGNGLVCPALPASGTMKGSDNGTMYTSEYYVMLSKMKQCTPTDSQEWETKIQTCTQQPGLTIRAPQDLSTDSPDNHLGILDAAQSLGFSPIAKQILSYGLKQAGWFNPSNPGYITHVDGTVNWSCFLWRQPQLLAASLAASHRLRVWHLPLTIYTALIILLSGLKSKPTNDSDYRRLTWHLIQIMNPVSSLCRLASKVWYWRLYKDYGLAAMRGVAATYYQTSPQHPFIKYWIE